MKCPKCDHEWTTLEEYVRETAEAIETSPEKRTDEQKRLVENVKNSPSLKFPDFDDWVRKIGY